MRILLMIMRLIRQLFLTLAAAAGDFVLLYMGKKMSKMLGQRE